MRLIDDPREGARPVIAPARRHPHRIAIALHDNPKARDPFMLPTRPISASWYTSERLQIAECPP